jgi:hypothetical protein
MFENSVSYVLQYIEQSVHGVENKNAFAGVLTVADVPAAASLKLVASFKVLLLALLLMMLLLLVLPFRSCHTCCCWRSFCC